MLFLKHPNILPFLCHKSVVICQINSNKASKSMLEPDLCNCVQIKTIEATAPPQQPRKWGTPCAFRSSAFLTQSLTRNYGSLFSNSDTELWPHFFSDNGTSPSLYLQSYPPEVCSTFFRSFSLLSLPICEMCEMTS